MLLTASNSSVPSSLSLMIIVRDCVTEVPILVNDMRSRYNSLVNSKLKIVNPTPTEPTREDAEYYWF